MAHFHIVARASCPCFLNIFHGRDAHATKNVPTHFPGNTLNPQPRSGSLHLVLATVLACVIGAMYVGRAIPREFCLKDLGTGRIYGPFDLIVDKQIDLAPLRYMTTREILGRYEIVNPSREELLFHQQLDKTIFKTFSVRQSSIQDVINILSYDTQEHWPDSNESIGKVKYELDLSNYAYWYKPSPDCSPAKLMTNEPPLQTWGALDVSLWTVINIIAEDAQLRPLIRGNTIIFTQNGVSRSPGSAAFKDWGPIKPINDIYQ